MQTGNSVQAEALKEPGTLGMEGASTMQSEAGEVGRGQYLHCGWSGNPCRKQTGLWALITGVSGNGIPWGREQRLL